MNKPTKEVEVHPSAHVHPEAVIGLGTIIDPCAVIGPNVQIAEDCRICSGAVIGAVPFSEGKKTRFGIEIGTGTLIGSNVNVQYGVLRSTKIGRNCWINHGCCIGHDVRIGNNVQLGLSTTVSGHSEIGNRVIIGPGSTLTNRSEIGNNSTVGIGSLVLHPVSANSTVLGRPAEPRSQYLKKSRELRRIFNAEQTNTRITGGGRRYFKFIPPSIRIRIVKLIRKVTGHSNPFRNQG